MVSYVLLPVKTNNKLIFKAKDKVFPVLN